MERSRVEEEQRSMIGTGHQRGAAEAGGGFGGGGGGGGG